MGWLVALPTLAVLVVFNKKVSPKNARARDVVAIVTMLLCWVAGCGIAYTFLAKWTAGGIAKFQGMFPDHNIRVGIALGLAVLLIGIAAADVLGDRIANKPAQFSAIILPTVLLLVIGGGFGKTGGAAVETTKVQMSTMWSNAGQ